MVGATAGLLTIVALLLALLWLGERRRESEREVARAIWSGKSEQQMFDCLSWLYDGFDIPQREAA